MKISRIVITATLLGLLSACSLPRSDLKSPCVGVEGSPCGPRIQVNEWWMGSEKA